MTMIHSKFLVAIANKLNELIGLEHEMVEKINAERDAIEKGIEEMSEKI